MLNFTCIRSCVRCLVGGFAGFLILSFVSPGYAVLSLELDRENGCYGGSETARLTINVDSAALEERKWTGTFSTERNWSGVNETATFIVSEKPVELLFEESEPAQVVVSVTIQGEDDPEVTHMSRIGMLFQAEQISLSTPEPSDFDAFWATEKKSWRELSQIVDLTPVESPEAGVLCWDLTILLDGESPVSGYLAMPESAEKSSLPALLLLHGAGVRSSSLPAAARFASEGFLALDINAHGLPDGKSRDFYEAQGRRLSGYPHWGVESRDDWYFRTMYLRVVTAIDYLCERPEWNGRDVVLRGSSQGGGQALAGAGLDSRVTVVAASVPALCDLSGELLGRQAGWPQPVRFAASKGDGSREKALETVRYFDVGLHASRSGAVTIVSIGLADSVCVATGIQAMANALPQEVELLYRPRMGHAIPPDIQAAFDAFITARVAFK